MITTGPGSAAGKRRLSDAKVNATARTGWGEPVPITHPLAVRLSVTGRAGEAGMRMVVAFGDRRTDASPSTASARSAAKSIGLASENTSNVEDPRVTSAAAVVGPNGTRTLLAGFADGRAAMATGSRGGGVGGAAGGAGAGVPFTFKAGGAGAGAGGGAGGRDGGSGCGGGFSAGGDAAAVTFLIGDPDGSSTSITILLPSR